jgi:hypothetical protein
MNLQRLCNGAAKYNSILTLFTKPIEASVKEETEREREKERGVLLTAN